MALFQAKISWKTLRKRENKNYCFVSFLPDTYRKFQRNSKKSQKIIVKPIWRHLQPKQVGQEREREKIKIIVLFCSYPKHNRKFQKNSKKKIKKL